MDVRRRLREVDRGLAGGIAATDDDDLIVAAELRFDRSRAVVDAETIEPGDIVEREPAVFGARRDDDDAGGDAGAGVRLDDVRCAIAKELDRALRDEDLGAELLGLRVGAAGELLSRDA